LSKNINIKIYGTTTFPASYGQELWPLTQKEERRMRGFEGRMIREIFGPKRKKWQNI